MRNPFHRKKITLHAERVADTRSLIEKTRAQYSTHLAALTDRRRHLQEVIYDAQRELAQTEAVYKSVNGAIECLDLEADAIRKLEQATNEIQLTEADFAMDLGE